MTNTNEIFAPVTLIEEFKLLAAFEQFKEKVTAFTNRIESDGVREILNYHFYARPENDIAFLIVTFKNANAFEEHIKFIFSGIEETKPYNETVKIKKLWVLGPMNDTHAEEIQSWVDQSETPYEWVEQKVTGFVR